MSSSQNVGIRVTYLTPPPKDLLKSQTMAVIAMMRAHGNIVLYAVCPACRAGRCLFSWTILLLQNSCRTVAEQWMAKFCEKEEKKKTKEGEKVAPRRQGSVCPQPDFCCWFTSIWVLRDPSRLKYQLLRDLVYKEAMCKGSFGNRLPYAARAVH